MFLDGIGHVRSQTGGFWVWGTHFWGSQVTQDKGRRLIPILHFLRLFENLELTPYTLPAFSGESQKQNLTDLDVWGVKIGVFGYGKFIFWGPKSLRSKEDYLSAVFKSFLVWNTPSAVLEIFVGFFQDRCLNRGFQVWRIHFSRFQVSNMLRLRIPNISWLKIGGNLKSSKMDSPYLITPT